VSVVLKFLSVLLIVFHSGFLMSCWFCEWQPSFWELDDGNVTVPAHNAYKKFTHESLGRYEKIVSLNEMIQDWLKGIPNEKDPVEELVINDDSYQG
jgi:hypothetical protein